MTSVKNSVEAKLVSHDLAEGERAILATGRLDTFRACYGARKIDDDGGIAIDAAAADALDVSAGDIVWSVGR